MRIPAEHAVIPWSKITEYLLVLRTADDKSKMLAEIGFDASNPEALEAALRRHVAENDAVIDRENEHGVYYRVEGPLVGPDGWDKMMITIWIVRAKSDGNYYFVTLKPL